MIKCQLIICLVFPLSSQPHYVFVCFIVGSYVSLKKNLLSFTFSNKRSLWFEKPLISHSDIMMFSLSISTKAAELVSSGDISALICLVCAAVTRGFVAPLQGRSSSYVHSRRVSGEVNDAYDDLCSPMRTSCAASIDQLHPSIRPRPICVCLLQPPRVFMGRRSRLSPSLASGLTLLCTHTPACSTDFAFDHLSFMAFQTACLHYSGCCSYATLLQTLTGCTDLKYSSRYKITITTGKCENT